MEFSKGRNTAGICVKLSKSKTFDMTCGTKINSFTIMSLLLEPDNNKNKIKEDYFFQELYIRLRTKNMPLVLGLNVLRNIN